MSFHSTDDKNIFLKKIKHLKMPGLEQHLTFGLFQRAPAGPAGRYTAPCLHVFPKKNGYVPKKALNKKSEMKISLF